MMRNSILLFSLIILVTSCSQPNFKVIPTGDNSYNSSVRGLYSVNNNVFWACGTGGVVFKTENNNVWISYLDTSLSKLDFRDIHAFNENEAVIMSSGDGCEIYRTSNGGKDWTKVYKNYDKGIFFDGMDFWDDSDGIAFSDPIDNHLYIIETFDGGKTWSKLNELPKTLNGEAGFAASGTGIQCVGDSTVYIGTGGAEHSRVFISHNRGRTWKAINTPMRTGEASGIYSLVFLDDKNGVVVGGNYLDSASTKGNCAITSDGGLTWKLPQTPPTGYMSCVTYNNGGLLICTGRNGIDVSYDKGNNWQHITDDAYYSCVMNKFSGWLTGRNGKMAKIKLE